MFASMFALLLIGLVPPSGGTLEFGHFHHAAFASRELRNAGRWPAGPPAARRWRSRDELPTGGTSPVTIDTVAHEQIAFLAAEESRQEARKQLVALGADAIPALLASSRHGHSHVRWEIVNLLGLIGDARGLDALTESATGDQNPHVRWRSLWALSRVANKTEILAALRPALQSDTQDVRWNAALALSFFGSAEGVPILHDGVRSADPFRRWEAINALGRTHDAATVDVLRPALRSPSVRDRNEVVLTLGNIGGAEAVALLLEALHDSAADVRWRAAMALRKAGHSSALHALQKAAQSDSDATVREHAGRAVAALQIIDSGPSPGR